MGTVNWPAGHEPLDAAINEINTGRSSASPEAVWAWLVRPDRWHVYYNNVRRVHHRSGPWPEIALSSRFSWTTFGARITTEVTECEPFQRLAWSASSPGSRAHHAWLLTATDDGGTLIYTQETHHGTVARLLSPAMAPFMHRMHQRWVDGLSRIAESGERP
jgi:uncharacterized protein YndB with AHSA1/START domain